MKKSIIAAAMLLSAGVLSAQEIKPKHEIINNTVKSTYYYDNGNIMQTGYYKNGKPQGSWVLYNEDGTRQAIGQFENGKKVGKWFFWTGDTLSEVDYSNNSIAQVKKWSKEAIAANK